MDVVRKKKKSAFDWVFDIVNCLLLGLFMTICLYPFYFIFINAISNPALASRGITITFYPMEITLRNFIEVFKQPDLAGAALVSLARTVLGTVLTVACSSFFGYLMSRQDMYFRKTIYRLLVVTMYFSPGLIPVYLVIRTYGMLNTFWVYLLPYTLSAYYVILCKTYIEQMPPSLEESAMLDGAGTMRIFARIVFPLSMPIIATIAVFAAVAQWNSWFDNYVYVPSNKGLKTLQLILRELLTQAEQIANRAAQSSGQLGMGDSANEMTPMAVRMTVTTVVTLPILFVYPFMQRFFVKGIMLGAIKG
jgi:putative aldouronate transport system permease protein